MNWTFTPTVKKIPRLNNPILVEGMPGIGNVGKIAADVIIEQIKAKKIYDIFSYDLPNSVFVNEKQQVELPVIEIYYKQFSEKEKNKNDLLILTGDVQPTEERSCYEFCEKVLEVLEQQEGKEIITLGGIGLAQIPKKPQVFCTGNNKEIVKRYKKGTQINDKIFGVVGPIMGVSGVLIGMAGKRKIPGICLLAETLGHPAYLGIKGAREIIKILDKKLGLKIKLNKLDNEIDELENELMKSQETGRITKTSLKKIRQRMGKETEYIG